jgi:SM-20-related protein
MKIRYRDFDPSNFSFHDHPVLVLQDFWSEEDMSRFRSAMENCHWTRLSEMPHVQNTFRDCGDWRKAELADPERDELIRRTLMPCVERYMQSFSDVKKGITSFKYCAYGAGDCLSVHSDLDSDDPDDDRRSYVRRRIALATYLHSEWQPDWGGEFVAYRENRDDPESPAMEASHWIAPEPGQLTLFTVPRAHRVCRVDPLAGSHERLSIAGWFMTEHSNPQD